MVPPARVAARKLAARTNENARLRQQLEAAATVVATLHHRRENIGRNGRSRRLVTPGRQDAAFVMVGSVGNISPRVPAGWGAGVEDQAGQVHDSWRAGPARMACPTPQTLPTPTDNFSGPNPHSRIAIDTTTPALCRVQWHFTETLMLASTG